MASISIIECTRCQSPQVFKPKQLDSDIPVALQVTINGGYMMFIDNVYSIGADDPFNFMLCHKCAHEFTKFMGISEPTVTRWHPKTEEEYCYGWEIK